MNQRIKVCWSVLLLSLLVFITFPAMTLNLDSSLQCELFAENKQQYVEGVKVSYQLTNTSTHQLKLLTWYTPLEGFMSNLFEITDSEGHQLAYQGPMFKRATPQEQDFITIAPQEKVSVTLNLLEAYPLTSGQYQVSLKPKMVQIVIDNQSISTQLCQHRSISVLVEK
ncbi:hypothetical protein [Thalassotalea ganghwensis]